MLLNVSYEIEGHTICALGDAAAWRCRASSAFPAGDGSAHQQYRAAAQRGAA